MNPADTAAIRTALLSYGIDCSSSFWMRPFTACIYGRHRPSGEEVFVKVLHSDEAGVIRNFHRELAILEKFAGRPGFPFPVALSRSVPFHACRLIHAPSLAVTDLLADLLPALLQVATLLIRWIADLHAAGYAHRDLSPDHVFWEQPDGVTIVDFGMAKSLATCGTDEAEQLLGTDLQSFGMILWEGICGRPLFSYRSSAIPSQIALEIEIIKSVHLPDLLARFLVECLSVRSEFTPTGEPSDSAAMLARTERLLKHLSRDSATLLRPVPTPEKETADSKSETGRLKLR